MSVLLSLLISLSALLPTASAPAAPPYSYVLMEGGTGTLLYAENGEAVVPAHHSAKLMTLLLTAEAIDSGRLSPDTVLAASAYANSMQGAQIWLMPGEEISVDELIKSVTVGNANDAAVVLAEAIGGSEEKFVAMMNRRAVELGMVSTSYADCTGISPKTVTTACDTAVLASKLTEFPLLTPYLTTWVTSVRGGKTELASTNRLILSYEGIIGTKAYYSESTGNCLVAAARRDGITMVCVIFGESDDTARFTTAKEKLSAGFSAYALYTPRRTDIYTEPVKVSGGEVTEVETELSELSPFVVRKSLIDGVEISVEYAEDLAAPLKKGDRVGKAVFSVGGEEIYSCPITASRDVRRISVFIGFMRALRAVVGM